MSSDEDNRRRPRAAVIGAGPAGLVAAETLAAGGVAVEVYDRMPSAGRKLLMAGRGGLNLTHSEPLSAFLARYGAATKRLAPAIEAFPPEALRAWADALGQETFVGSSGRVFPRAMKASPLLRAWLRRLDAAGVRFHWRHRWLGWDETGRLRFEVGDEERVVSADATFLAMGGASWPKLGSDGGWARVLWERGVSVAPLRPSNMGFDVAWSSVFRERFAGQPLKRIAVSLGAHAARGEAMVSAAGIEGGAIYAVSAPLRERIAADGPVTVHIDLRPDVVASELVRRLSVPRARQSASTFLRKAVGLTPVEIGLLREAGAGALPEDAAALAALVKAVPLRIEAPRPIERAISSAGGVTLDEVDDRWMLRRLPGVFAAGEMLDWEAPTGGYLLQACFSTGIAAAKGALAWLEETAPQR